MIHTLPEVLTVLQIDYPYKKELKPAELVGTKFIETFNWNVTRHDTILVTLKNLDFSQKKTQNVSEIQRDRIKYNIEFYENYNYQ